MRRAGLAGRADGDPAHPAVSDVVADLEAEGVAVEGQRGVRVVVREEAGVNGDVHGGHASCGAGAARFSIPDRSGHLLGHARRHPRRRARGLAPVGAGRHADQLGEARAERAQRRAADREADLGDAEVAAPQQRHRPLDAPRHQVAVRRLAVGEPELAAEVPGRHVRAAGERLDVQRLRVLAVDPVANPAQPREVAQVLRRGGTAGHQQIVPHGVDAKRFPTPVYRMPGQAADERSRFTVSATARSAADVGREVLAGAAWSGRRRGRRACPRRRSGRRRGRRRGRGR